MSLADSITSSKQFEGNTDPRVSLVPVRGVREKKKDNGDDDDDNGDDDDDGDNDENVMIASQGNNLHAVGSVELHNSQIIYNEVCQRLERVAS